MTTRNASNQQSNIWCQKKGLKLHEITMNMTLVTPSRLALLASRQPCEANWKQSSSYSTHVAFTWTHREHNSMKSSCTCRYSIVISVPPCHSWHGPIWSLPQAVILAFTKMSLPFTVAAGVFGARRRRTTFAGAPSPPAWARAAALDRKNEATNMSNQDGKNERNAETCRNHFGLVFVWGLQRFRGLCFWFAMMWFLSPQKLKILKPCQAATMAFASSSCFQVFSLGATRESPPKPPPPTSAAKAATSTTKLSPPGAFLSSQLRTNRSLRLGALSSGPSIDIRYDIRSIGARCCSSSKLQGPETCDSQNPRA